MNKDSRIFGLDILRAAAIIFVMWSHGHVYSAQLLDVKYYRWLMWDGVGLFFVLSGFLIGRILINTAMTDGFAFAQLRQFWLRRWLRTLPLYYLVLTVLVVLYFVSHHCLPPHVFAYYTFTQNFASPHPLFFGEAWSLSVEEWFYLLLPLLVLVVLSRPGNKQRQLAILIFIFWLVGTVIRTYKAGIKDYLADESFGVEIMKQVITRLDSIMYGVIAAWFYVFKPVHFFKYKKSLMVFGVLCMFFSVAMLTYSSFFHNYVYYSASAIAVMCMLPWLSTIKIGNGMIARAFSFISLISYSMYLSNHMLVQRALMPVFIRLAHLEPDHYKMHALCCLIMFWFLTLVMAYVFYRFWEKPFMQKRQFLLAAKQQDAEG